MIFAVSPLVYSVYPVTMLSLLSSPKLQDLLCFLLFFKVYQQSKNNELIHYQLVNISMTSINSKIMKNVQTNKQKRTKQQQLQLQALLSRSLHRGAHRGGPQLLQTKQNTSTYWF